MMARTVRDRRIESRTARAALPRRPAPYWRVLGRGRALGYSTGKGAGSWLARYRSSDGTRYQRLLGQADDIVGDDEAPVLDYAAAQEAARLWFTSLDANHGRLRASVTVDQLLDHYLDGFQGKSKAKTQWAIDRRLRPVVGQCDVAELTAARLGAVLRELADAPAMCRGATGMGRERATNGAADTRARQASANRLFAVLKAALNRAYRDGLVDSDEAWRKVKPFARVDAPRIRYLSDEEARELVNHAASDFRPLVQTALLTGARWSELCRMEVRDVDLVAGAVLLPETKGGRPRHVYLTDEGLRLFASLCRSRRSSERVFLNRHGRPFGPSHQSRPMREACTAAKIDPAGFHVLRHTYGSRLAMAGVPMAVIAEALGHADERITRRHYAHLSPSYVRDAIRKGLGELGIVATPTARRLRAV